MNGFLYSTFVFICMICASLRMPPGKHSNVYPHPYFEQPISPAQSSSRGPDVWAPKFRLGVKDFRKPRNSAPLRVVVGSLTDGGCSTRWLRKAWH